MLNSFLSFQKTVFSLLVVYHILAKKPINFCLFKRFFEIGQLSNRHIRYKGADLRIWLFFRFSLEYQKREKPHLRCRQIQSFPVRVQSAQTVSVFMRTDDPRFSCGQMIHGFHADRRSSVWGWGYRCGYFRVRRRIDDGEIACWRDALGA